ncbi:MAG: phosphoribosylformylglycinamidine synthase subunit PurS [Leptospiraceae bacterium]|nr:phosphoribosylformylglycinamidine synthase subunit PurS [Leptospiraceae bacterium]MCP5501492.1 phosphoribosylformylglycinamidine synthase subunit PurS [Leptospiraceae bacterium]
MFIGKISITLKESVLDPQGAATIKVLQSIGENEVEDLRVGKYIEIKLNTPDEETARKDIDRLCKNLLVNPVIETYKVQIEKVQG